MRKKPKENIKKSLRKAKPKVKRFLNILVAVALFVLLISSAFSISLLFGIVFIVGFALSIYNEDLKKKPWKPIAIFMGAIIIRIAMEQFFDPVFSAQTLMDLTVSALIFLSILVIGWKVKRS
jgi:uncharacterized membrane protein HdeD (DUF308 family)